MEKKDFIHVFGEIGISALGGKDVENEAPNTASIICYGLDALCEFGGITDFRSVYLMKCICDKFDPKDRTGKEVHQFIENVSTLVVQSNRFVWDFGKISNEIKKLENS